MGDNLKFILKYLKLLFFLKKEKIRLKTDSFGQNSYFISLGSDINKKLKTDVPLIVINKALPKEEKMIIILHELGHYFHFKKTNLNWPQYMKKYCNTTKNKLKIEKIAWKKAKNLLNYFNFSKSNDLFNALKKDSLFSYKIGDKIYGK